MSSKISPYNKVSSNQGKWGGGSNTLISRIKCIVIAAIALLLIVACALNGNLNAYHASASPLIRFDM